VVFATFGEDQNDGHTKFARDLGKPINLRLENHYSFNPKNEGNLESVKPKVLRQRKKEIAISLGIMIILIIGLLAYYHGPSQMRSPSEGSSVSSKTNMATVLLAGTYPVLGSSSAPVTIVEFGDFQCTTCGAWFRSEEPRLLQGLVNTGRAKLAWRDFPYLGPDSIVASEAAYAAGEQGKFWEYYDLLYTNQGVINSGWASREDLRQFASQLGLDMSEFNASLQSNRYLQLVDSNYNLGTSVGVTMAPTFFVIGPQGKAITIVGDQPYSVFQTAVDTLVSG
jgi:protein-disulfide isomerase